MPNDLVFSDPKAPLTDLDDLIVSQSIIAQGFQVFSEEFSGSGGMHGPYPMVMVLTNPAGSKIQAVIDMVVVSTTSSTNLAPFTMRFNGTASGLSSTTPYCLNAGETGPACTVAEGGNSSSVDLTGGKVFYREYLSAEVVLPPMGIVLSPGNTFGLLYDFGVSSVTGTMTIRWFEIPLTGGFAT